MNKRKGRGGDLADAFALLLWLSERNAPFTVYDLAAEGSVCKRTAYRRLTILEAFDLVERSHTAPLFWRSKRNSQYWRVTSRLRSLRVAA